MVLASAEILLWQFGGLNLGRFQATAPVERTCAYSWVMNNYWTTNFRASLEGEFQWGYSLTSLADPSAGAASRAAQDMTSPMLARVLTPGRAVEDGPGHGLLRGDLPHLLRVCPAAGDGQPAVTLQFREPDGTACTVPLAACLNPVLVHDLTRVDAAGWTLAPLAGDLTLGPHEVAFVRVGLRGQHRP